LCARIPIQKTTDEAFESLAHVLFDCPHLRQEQTPLEQTAVDALAATGGLCKEPDGRRFQWQELLEADKLGILLGNPTTYLLYSFPNPQLRKDWVSGLLLDTTPQIRCILDRRATLIAEHYDDPNGTVGT
jgi:hypothetical protein